MLVLPINILALSCWLILNTCDLSVVAEYWGGGMGIIRDLMIATNLIQGKH